MSEQCPIRTEELLFDDSLTDAGIPQKCMGCLALAMNERISSTRSVDDMYDEAVSQMVDADDEFSPVDAGTWTTTMFEIPADNAHRKVTIDSGFDDDGGDPFGATFSEETIEFDCPIELGET